MSSRKTGDGQQRAYAAAEKWVDRALRSDDSLFTPGVPIWSRRWLDDLRRRFLDKPDEWNRPPRTDFFEKLERLLVDSPPEVYQLMGEVIYVSYLVVLHRERGGMSESTKRERIEQVLGWSPRPTKVPDDCADGLAPGLVHPGPSFTANFGLQFGYFIEFVEQWKERGPDDRLLDSMDAEAAWEFKEFVMGVDWCGPLRGSPSNGRALQQATVLHLVHPDTFEAILSVDHKNAITERFAYVVREPTEDIDRKLVQVRRGLEAELGRDFDFYDGEVSKRWRSSTSDPWDDFVGRAKSYVDSGRLESEEIPYKLEIGRDLASARDAVLNHAEDWQDLLKRALRAREGHPIAWQLLGDFNRWCADYSEQALRALQKLWSRDDSTITERIRAFGSEFPKTAVKGALGSRTNLISVLLMGLDIEQFPPYRVGVFTRAYDSAGYGRPEGEADEAAVYEHALTFLDRFIDEAAERGLELRHRLDAQSVVWGMSGSETSETTSPPQPDALKALAAELHVTADFLGNIEKLLEDKKQVIFQGPPGTGKTYVARKLAKHLAGSDDRVDLVQLHPSYAYEDFVQGFRPTLRDGQPGFDLMDGPLLEAAKRARGEPDETHFLLIDEINRGNVAKVFGELYFLLEYRDEKIRLQYQRNSGETFELPGNLYIIGTMNTADRSIALVDLALRRRFNFVEFHPDEEPVKGVLRRWLKEKVPDMERVADIVDRANEKLRDDRHAAIGPSYFMKGDLDEDAVRRIWKHSVLPYIEELLFGQGDRLGEFDLEELWEAGDTDRADDDGPTDA